MCTRPHIVVPTVCGGIASYLSSFKTASAPIVNKRGLLPRSPAKIPNLAKLARTWKNSDDVTSKLQQNALTISSFRHTPFFRSFHISYWGRRNFQHFRAPWRHQHPSHSQTISKAKTITSPRSSTSALHQPSSKPSAAASTSLISSPENLASITPSFPKSGDHGSWQAGQWICLIFWCEMISINQEPMTLQKLCSNISEKSESTLCAEMSLLEIERMQVCRDTLR